MPLTLRQWLKQIGLQEYADRFEENNIDFGVLSQLTSSDLREIGIKAVGDRRRLIAAAKQFRVEAAAVSAGSHRRDQAEASRNWTGGAERRNLAVLFCDLVGSTHMSEQMDAEELRDIVAGYQSTAVRVVQKYGGRISQFMGDGVLAYFGWPSARENNSESAVRAALELGRAVKESGLSCRIGIATGPVVVGDIESDNLRLKDQVVGRTPNLAARLQVEAEADTIVVSSETRELAGEEFVYSDLGLRTMKGIASSVRLWRVDGLRLGGPVKHFAHWDTPIFGRVGQLDALMRLWNEAKCGARRSVLVQGDPGIGKSRLVAEVLTHAEPGQDSVLLEFQCSPFHSHEPLFPVLDQLRRAILPQASIGTSALFQALVTDTSQERRDTAQALIALLSGDPHGHFAGLTARGRKERTFSAIESVLDTLSLFRTLLIVVEDLHWADPSTIEFFQRFVHDPARRNALAVFTCRSEATSQLSDMRFDAIVDVPRLSNGEVNQLIEAITGSAALPRSVRAAIADRSDGVPLYVEELAKSVLDGKHLSEAKQEREVNLTSVPMTLHDSLIARIDRLAIKMEIPQAAAAIGREFSSHVLKTALGYRGSEVENALRRLISAQVVKADPGRPDHYIFKHSLMRDAIYESMLSKARKTVHCQIAVALENTHSAAGSPHVLAHHWASGGNDIKAFEYYSQAATLAKGKFANKEAIAYFRASLHHLGLAADVSDSSAAELKTTLLEQLSEVQFLSHNIDKAESALREAMELAPNEPLQRARLLRKLGVALQQDRDRSLQVLDEAEQALKKLGDTSTKDALGEWIEIQLSRCNANYWSGNGNEMSILLDQIAPHLDDCSAEQLAEFFNQCVLRDLRLQRYRASLATIEHARDYVKAAKRTHNLATISSSKFILGFTYLHSGRLRTAARTLLSGMQAAQRSGHKAIELRCRVYLGLAYRLQGEVEAAIETAKEAAETARIEAMSEYVGLASANLAWGYWRRGRLGDARSEAERAMREFDKSKIAYPFEWTALLILLATDDQDCERVCDRLLKSTQQELPKVVRTGLEKLAASSAANRSSILQLLISACRRRNLL
ncbi:AAA family ATPase [Sinorhizobium terangae]|uniref:AAA family ATPase n=1 Tax=Sinorhizobium terangae TaxID=110322 RepID=UPI0024B0BD7D|nr:adenylate/guanylate cyclase domain-containing protein [Sinorhizobium terangae]WFU50523.1 adenylate/guanylate cyclase domain-containing protein [Sinorhizobium terangae]